MPPSLSLDQQAIADLFDAHMLAELDGDLDGTLATMVEDPHLLNLPSGTGGLGAEGVRAFDANDLIGQFSPPMPCSFPSPARSMASGCWLPPERAERGGPLIVDWAQKRSVW